MVTPMFQTPTPLSDIEGPSSTDLARPEVFARADRAVEDWYWAIPSAELKAGDVSAVTLLGRELAIYRGADGVVRAIDAHCPHQGAHFGHGQVVGDDIRCPMHGWTFNSDGSLVEIPCQQGRVPVKVATWPVRERYGLIWVYTARMPREELFTVVEASAAGRAEAFQKQCHPTVLLAHAADEQHLMATRHAGEVRLEVDDSRSHLVTCRGTVGWSTRTVFTRLFAALTSAQWSYTATIFGASAVAIRLRDKKRDVHILFAMRPTPEGHTEGQWVTLGKNRGIARRVAKTLAHADDVVFATMKWSFQTPTASDRPTIRVIKRIEKLPPIEIGTWRLLRDLVSLSRARRKGPLDEETVDTVRPIEAEAAFEEPTKGSDEHGSGFEDARSAASAPFPRAHVESSDMPFEEDKTRADEAAMANLLKNGGTGRSSEPGFEEPTRPDQTGA